MKIFKILSLALALSGCGTFGNRWWFGTPTNNSITEYGIIRVSAAPSLHDPTDVWTADQRRTIQNSLNDLNRLGPTFILVNNEANADVVVYKTQLECTVQAGRYTENTRFVEVDPRCTTSSLELQTVVSHEIGHALGMRHVCYRDSETNGCSNVGTGHALMNPNLFEGPEIDEDLHLSYPQWEVTELDIQEFRRAWALNH
jgi:hypothetical protein